jgi:hypothetical protein
VTDMTPNAESWKSTLGAGPDCLSIERLSAQDWTADEQRHVAECVACQAEMQLWASFRDDAPGEDGAVVQEIAARLAAGRRPSPGRVIGRIGPLVASPWIWMRMAAAVLIVVGLGYFAIDREPGLRRPGGETSTYRSGAVQLVAPLEDVSIAPTEFTWVVVPGAVTYDVVVREVDGTVLWSASTAGSPLPVPADVVGRFVPGKTLSWIVSAKAAQGDVLATSSAQRFRVTVR